jgi:hypothetical protein
MALAIQIHDCKIVGFGVPAVVTACSSEIAERLRVEYRLYLQGRRISQVRNQQKQAANLLVDGGGRFLRNVGLSQKYTALQHRRQRSLFEVY